MSATGSTKSILEFAIALRGMSSYSASSGDCTKVTPPCSSMRAMPTAPSAPVPDSTIPTALLWWVSASVRKNRSMAT